MIKIAIDAGHGLDTQGKEVPSYMGYGSIKEWELNDRVSTELISRLKNYIDILPSHSWERIPLWNLQGCLLIKYQSISGR